MTDINAAARKVFTYEDFYIGQKWRKSSTGQIWEVWKLRPWSQVIILYCSGNDSCRYVEDFNYRCLACTNTDYLFDLVSDDTTTGAPNK